MLSVPTVPRENRILNPSLWHYCVIALAGLETGTFEGARSQVVHTTFDCSAIGAAPCLWCDQPRYVIVSETPTLSENIYFGISYAWLDKITLSILVSRKWNLLSDATRCVSVFHSHILWSPTGEKPWCIYQTLSSNSPKSLWIQNMNIRIAALGMSSHFLFLCTTEVIKLST